MGWKTRYNYPCQLVHGGRKPDKYKRWGKALGSYLAQSENIHEWKPDIRNMERPFMFQNLMDICEILAKKMSSRNVGTLVRDSELNW